MLRSTGPSLLVLVSLAGFAMAGCQPWSGNYAANQPSPPVSITTTASLLQISSQVVFDLDIAISSTAGECNMTTTGCPGTTGTGPNTFTTSACTFTVSGSTFGCNPDWGTSFLSGATGTEIASVGGSVDKFTLAMTYVPFLGGPITWPAPLD